MKKLTSAVMAVVLAAALTACGGSGSGQNPTINGMTGPDIEMVNGKLLLSMTFQNVFVDGGVTIPIPKYPGSSLQVGPDFQSNGTLLVLTISVPDFLGNQGQGLDPQTLPGGRPLPGVAAGNMPAVALQIKQLFNTVLYVGPQVIGFFVPFKKLDMGGSIVTFRFYDKESKPVGLLSLVGADQSGANAGVLAMMRADLLGIIPLTKKNALQLAQTYN